MSDQTPRSSAPLPLADAQRRLGKPGRPRTRPLEADRPLAGEAEGRPARPPSMRSPASTWPGLCPPGRDLAPRLLDVEAAARYLGALSPRSVRTLIDSRVLRRVRVPLGEGELRRVLVDRLELDELIERWKDGAEDARSPS